MHRRLPLLLALGLAAAVAHAGNTLRVDSQVLTVGDSASRVVKLLGQPAYKEPVQNRYGAYRGERWQYERDGRVVNVVIVGGKVGAIEELQR
ncbi:DUF2845 domain-containing protein [Fulvimonas soli]|uniref:Uncharacterized protein DUF2845 n=1 Tax=Fulvimonas soli TaxID=155197 RepID=A0A316IF66_9GAMM|nr:DUF2845 domain-containing protein [Fulvimonas soli]PWK85904.1 uncharacterized protein DUF2845 [Fulvimonas soli]TNY25969.1 DUF2845 domain-containing protein [Fulvimonas soli]